MTARSPEPRVAVFAGSFNPFTIGHADILSRGLELFDKVVVCVGVNAAKPGDADDAADRADAIKALYASCPRVEVVAWTGLTADCARRYGARFLLRGVRSVKDMEYERDMADANAALMQLDTVLLLARPELGWVSSSLVRELRHHGSDYSALVPKPIDENTD